MMIRLELDRVRGTVGPLGRRIRRGEWLPRERNLERNPGLGERLGLRPEVYRLEEWLRPTEASYGFVAVTRRAGQDHHPSPLRTTSYIPTFLFRATGNLKVSVLVLEALLSISLGDVQDDDE
jgi:hypothetical protein